MEYQMIVESKHERDSINALQLSDFLQKFRAAYVVALSFAEYVAPIERDFRFQSEQHFESLNRSFREFLRASRSISAVTTLSKQHLPPEYELEFLQISTNSPLKFIGYCTGASLLALSLAVSLAGGEADLKTMTFKVQPLADAVLQITRELRRP
jgi:hypothetical protein